MIRCLVALLIASLALPAFAAVYRAAPARPLLLAAYTGGPYNTGTVVLSVDVGPITITRWTGRVGNVGGGGAGDTVITATDGTNSCTFTLACSVSSSSNPFDILPVTTGGAGCSFPGRFLMTVTTAGCTTTQPTPRTSLFIARWQ